MQTSYFAKHKEKPDGVAITLYTPKWFKGPTYTRLAPTKQILTLYKAGALTEQDYERLYYEQVLDQLCVYEVYHDLKDKTLLCYEKSSDFCHRHLVAKWIKDQLGLDVLEV